MFNLRCADAMCQRAKRTVCRGVAVAAYNGHTGQCPTLFWTNDVHNPLTHVRYGIIMNAEILGIFESNIGIGK